MLEKTALLQENLFVYVINLFFLFIIASYLAIIFVF
jgi:hypothetical protein